jgi:hypothetical protein
LEETRNHTAWDNHLKGCVSETRNRRHGKGNRKSTEKQLITHFLWTLEAAFDPASDTDAHLDKSTIIFVIGKLQSCKTKQDLNTQDQGKTNKDKERNNHRREEKKEDFRRVRWFTQARPPPD